MKKNILPLGEEIMSVSPLSVLYFSHFKHSLFKYVNMYMKAKMYILWDP